MHDIKWIRENPAAFKSALVRRGLDAETIFADVEKLDGERRANIALTQKWQEDLNRKSKEIGKAKAAKDETLFTQLMAEVSRLKSDITKAASEVSEDSAGKLGDYLAAIPNLPLAEVPTGKNEQDNEKKSEFGAKRNYAFTPKQHFELGEALGQMDFEAAAKLSGARFVVLKKGLARLERALGQFMLDVHTGEHEYEEINPPLLVKDETMFGTAQLPKFKDDQFQTVLIRKSRPTRDGAKRIIEAFQSTLLDWLKEKKSDDLRFSVKSSWTLFDSGEMTSSTFKKFSSRVRGLLKESGEKVSFQGLENSARLANTAITSTAYGIAKAVLEEEDVNDRLWLVPTAEVPLTNLAREKVVEESELPRRYTALTPCFRQEAGAAGRDTRGMIRQHQFTKVELVSITTPEQSAAEHDRMLACAEKILQKLGLHYRVMTLCTGDMGFASQKTYDIEVWLPGQNAYREISSCSVCGDFQARRMQARYRTKADKIVRHVHTLNGSGVAVGRALIAVMETYQQEDGSIAVPDVLQKYMGGMTAIGK